jgi:anti-sigma factor RsiW
MLAHRSSDTLYGYADGTLPDRQRAQIDAHLRVCGTCRRTVHEIRRLDSVLQDFPAAPNLPFPRFWSRLEGRLPSRAEKRLNFFRARQLAAGLALAIVASVVGVVALASDETMPDSPLYSVKRVRQDVQLLLTSARERPSFELTLGRQRLHEAAVMTQRNRHDLAVASLREARALLVEAAPGLGQSDAAALRIEVDDLKTELQVIRDANVPHDGMGAAEKAALDSAVVEAQTAVTQVETRVDHASPAPTESASPDASPMPSISNSATPEPSAQPSETPSE